ncbi:MAG TPA: ATP-dependent zinc metalloprotease FtsH [bacterium]|nr:ATP-dependent zinc metalloprotease FtsH [bacterium]HMY35781.1 ATP-dependent zinc metalloprotease FtsH [bacterium]HNB08980.1 ATP-dependent zinc metalloprotease FtsH [bacterium]HND77589.1 ATP-dependent zinc metalloprotease FtsH [bacterium]HNF86393.1 ATP-dependent zinc metalloprotease FtsH [bacterium]
MENQNAQKNDAPKPGPTKKKNRPSPDSGPNWKGTIGTFFLWIAIFGSFFFLYQIVSAGTDKHIELSFTQYQFYLEQDKIRTITVGEGELRGTLKAEETITTDGTPYRFTQFRINLPFVDSKMLDEWKQRGVDVEFMKRGTDFGTIILQMLPWILAIAILIFIFRRMQGGPGGKNIFTFGKSRARMSTDKDHKVTFTDVAGCEEAKQELSEIVDFLKDPNKFTRLGGRIPRGALLLGPPGTGKTLLARAVAGEAEVPFFSISGADFVEMFVGVGAARVRDLFEQAKRSHPCIIFIDEIDAVGRSRGAGLGGGHDEREQTLNQLLVEMDGFEENSGIIILAATNRPDILDNALMRPGRFDRQVVVDYPDVKGREEILKIHCRKVPISDEVKIEKIAKGTPGLAGADLENLVNEAALLAARRNSDKVENIDFENAKDKVMMGVERKSMVISDKEKRSTAYHEAGHALVGRLLPESDAVHKVTIIPRGRALGITHYLPSDDRHSYSRTYIEARLAMMMGGRAAEKIIYNHYTTGASNDIERATEMARRMICEWGMSDALGPVAFGKKDEEVFLGREIATSKNYSENTAVQIDAEIKRIVSEAENKALSLIEQNIQTLHNIANALVERETIDSEELDMILKGQQLPPLEILNNGQSAAKIEAPVA